MKVISIIIFWLIAIVVIIPTIFSGLNTYEEELVEKNSSPKKHYIFKQHKIELEEDNNILDNNDRIIKVYICDKDIVQEFPIEEYIKGVVAAEMPASFNIEALKAQAVAARTYIYNKLFYNSNNEEHNGAIVCTDPAHCKAWVSKEDAFKKWNSNSCFVYWNKISKAADTTKNQIVIYNDNPIDALFHSTCSGWTENSEDVWKYKIPYLRTVKSKGDFLSPKYKSEYILSTYKFKNMLKNSLDIDIEEDDSNIIGRITKTEGKNVKNIYIGGKQVKGTKVREVFDLNSTNFSISFEDDKVTFNVLGNGHEVGMSQYGANYLALNGKDYVEIIKYYYTDVDIIEISY